jgi:hypothetical protein
MHRDGIAPSPRAPASPCLQPVLTISRKPQTVLTEPIVQPTRLQAKSLSSRAVPMPELYGLDGIALHRHLSHIPAR